MAETITVQRLELVNPTVEPASSEFQPASRLKTLRGARAGLIDNSKTNAAVFLDELCNLLDARHGFSAVLRVRKPGPDDLPRPEDLSRLVAETDFVLAGVGD